MLLILGNWFPDRSITATFGMWWEQECQSIKSKLAEMDPSTSGRVCGLEDNSDNRDNRDNRNNNDNKDTKIRGTKLELKMGFKVLLLIWTTITWRIRYSRI